MTIRTAARQAFHCRPTAHAQPLLAPLAPCRTSSAPFSTSQPQCAGRDRNRKRGVSVIRRTGLRKSQTLEANKLVEEMGLPEPVYDQAKRVEQVEVDEDHGLWQFFNPERRILATAQEDIAFGRAWTTHELALKSWEDLHSLWWVCVKERNRLASEAAERVRLEAGYGEHESTERDKEVKTTMYRLRFVLLNRWYAFGRARDAAMEQGYDLDPSIPDSSTYKDEYKPPRPQIQASIPTRH